MFYDRTVLDNGVTVISERIDSVRSVALGLWVAAGSRDEHPAEAGVSHFIEHMMFKGTSKHSAQEISEAFESLGAEVNAFTSKEFTCYYSRVIDRHAPDAFSLIAEMVDDSVMDEQACVNEREVVLEEISRAEDTPDDKVHDLFAQALWPDHPLGGPVLGTKEAVGGFMPADIRRYTERKYRTGDVVIAAAGNMEHADVVGMTSELLSSVPTGDRTSRDLSEPQPGRHVCVSTKDTEQAHICLGTLALPACHEDRFALGILDAVLGGGMASRLFQEIREKRGLAYSVYSYHGQYLETGSMTVYAGTRPDNTAKVIQLIGDEIDRVVADGITAEELDRARESMKGHLVLGLENTNSRMTRLGRSEIGGVEILSIDELIERFSSVTLDDVQRVARETIGGPRTLAVVGPHEQAEMEALLP